MKLPLRIVFPVLAAVIIVAGVLGLIWWQLSITAERLKDDVRRGGTNRSEEAQFPADDPVDDGDEVLVHLRQGDLLALQGDWADAQTEYQASVDAGGGVPALRKLAQAQLQRRDIDGVRRTIGTLKDEGARDEDLLLLEAIVLLRTGELVKARQLLDEAADSPQKHYGLALLAIVDEDHDRAKTELVAVQAGWEPTLRAFAKTLHAAFDEYAQFPQSRPIHLTTLLARALAEVHECEVALPLLAQVLNEQDDYRDAWVVQGYCDLATERNREALASFERAYGLDPEKPEIQYFLGRTYSALDDHKNATTFLRYALQNGFEPQEEVRRRLADAALASNDNALALEQYRALAAAPTATINTFDALVTLELSANQKDEAVATATTATTRWPEDAKAHELLGRALAEADKTEEARAALLKALELDPGLESAREKLRKL